VIDEILKQAISLGIAGLLFVMWWNERKERQQTCAGLTETVRDRTLLTDITTNLVNVIRSNTEMLAALREELRSHRQAESQWIGMVIERLERLPE
jgi:hypothetical protein